MSVTGGAEYPESAQDGMSIDPMAQTPAHAKRRPEGLIAAWLCLIIAGAATVTFNIVNAWHSGMASPLGFIEGVVPVALAMIVSHLVAVSSAGRLLRGITFAVMIGALALSVRATGAVVAPASGPLWWLYGAVVDTAALASLQVLLTLRSRAAKDARERAAQEVAVADERAVLSAQVDALTAELETRHGSLMSDLEAERAARENAQRELAEALTRAEMLARKLAAKSAQPGASRARKDKQASAQDEDLTLEFRALDELQKDPDLRKPRMGGELARRLGVSPATGRRLHGRLTAQDRSAGSLSERSAERPGERSGERS